MNDERDGCESARPGGAHGLLIEAHVSPMTSYTDAAQTIDVATLTGVASDAELLARLDAA